MTDLKAAILAADDLPREVADVSWDLGGERLFVRGLTASEKDQWVARTMPSGEFAWTSNITAELVAATLIDADGERIFSDEDAAALGQKSSSALSTLFAQAMRLSGLSEDTNAELEQGLGIGQSSHSSTG